MTLRERIAFWRAANRGPEFCREAERIALELSGRTPAEVDAALAEFDAEFARLTS